MSIAHSAPIRRFKFSAVIYLIAQGSMEPQLTQWWASFCPSGDECGRKGKRLGTYRDEFKAREAIFNHLQNSPKHDWPSDQAQIAADGAELTLEEWPMDKTWQEAQAPAEPRPKARVAPYQQQARDARSTSSQLTTPAPSDSQFAGIMLAASMKAEQAARASSRIACQAANAFDEEAENFASAARHFRQVLER